ncbi:MAG TPA: DoxX family protein [Gemmatimonas sp.]|nr:DoxX family protein [Gemmatimonas sp.]
MTLAYRGLTALSVIVFLYFGASCLFANGMAAEFERYGLSRLRLLTGALELLGGLGLAAGQFIDGLVPVSAGGLALLMAMATLTRFRARDPWPDILPAVAMMLLNAFLVVVAVNGGPA